MRQGEAALQLPPEVNSYGVTLQKSTAAPLMLFDLYSPNGSYNSEFPANYAYLWKLTNDSWSTDSDDSSTPTAKQ
jgi:HAE1 family hydrophobic/amphiphilic exporter-1